MTDWQARNLRLKGAFDLVAVSFNAEEHRELVSDAFRLLEVNEAAVALEIMCDNLYELGCGVPLRAYEVFAEVGTELNVDSRNWKMLEPRIVP